MFSLQRALVAQRNELKVATAALADVVFGFDPQLRFRLPFSLIETQTGTGEGVRTYSGVPWIALETLSLAVSEDTVVEVDPIVDAIASLSGKPWRSSVSRAGVGYVACRIWVAHLVGHPTFRVTPSAVMGARDVIFRWQGYASWEN